MPDVRGPLAYLAGAIEHAPDGGRRWRRSITASIDRLGHRVFDPTKNEHLLLNEEERLHFRGWKETDLPRFQQTVRRIIARDLDVITSEADYVICYWDEPATRGAGTQAEITLAHRLGKPVYLVTAMPRAKVSGWVLGCATQVFDDLEALGEFLERASR
jgi:nucleoside 2-deoxyribosyltransferase